jgi:hypothetical protein
MTIQGIKLVTGEEIVATVLHTHDDQVFVKDALVLRVASGPNGLVINFFPWTIIADGQIPINNSAIVSRFPVPKDVENSYIQNTTGLQIVSATPQILHG